MTETLKSSFKQSVDAPNGTIHQMFENAVGEVSRWVIDTRNRETQNALILLGWRPPAAPQIPLFRVTLYAGNDIIGSWHTTCRPIHCGPGYAFTDTQGANIMISGTVLIEPAIEEKP